MAIDAYIQIEGIPGESLDDKHRNWIEILGYNFGTPKHLGDRELDRRSVLRPGNRDDLQLYQVSRLGKLQTHGSQLRRAALCESDDCVAPGGRGQAQILRIVLEEVIISDYSQSASDGVPREVVQLDYGRIKANYTQQRRNDGSGGGNVTGGWDRIKNTIYA